MEQITLSASLYIPRSAKDGVGILSTQTLFAISTSKYTEPSSSSPWVQSINDLALSADKYVWQCSQYTYTDGHVEFTGKTPLAPALDYATQSTQYALSSSDTQAPGSSSFTPTYTAVKGRYLWSRIQYLFTTTKGSTTHYSTPVCIAYFATDGTSFSPQGTATGYYALASQIANGHQGDIYLVDKDDRSSPQKNYPCVYTLLNVNTSVRADAGDAYNVNGNLYVNNGTAWANIGSIKGPKGDSNLCAIISPSAVVFSADKNGNINEVSKGIYILPMLGSQYLEISKCEISVAVNADSNIDISSLNLMHYNSGTAEKLVVYSEGITKNIYGEGSYRKEMPCSSGYFIISVKYQGMLMQVTVPFTVEYSYCIGKVFWDDYEFTSRFEKVESKASEQGALIEKNASNIKQTAEQIKLQVENSKDLKNGLVATGIDLANRRIVLTSDQFECRNNRDERTAWLDDTGVFTATGVFNNLITVVNWKEERGRDKIIVAYFSDSSMTPDSYVGYLGVDGKYYNKNGAEDASIGDGNYFKEIYLDILRIGQVLRIEDLHEEMQGSSNSYSKIHMPFYIDSSYNARTLTRFNSLSTDPPHWITADELRMLCSRTLTIHTAYKYTNPYTRIAAFQYDPYSSGNEFYQNTANNTPVFNYPASFADISIEMSFNTNQVYHFSCQQAFFFRRGSESGTSGYVWTTSTRANKAAFEGIGLDSWT